MQERFYPPPEPEDNTEDNTLSLPQSNNQAIQPQTSSLRDTIADSNKINLQTQILFFLKYTIIIIKDK